MKRNRSRNGVEKKRYKGEGEEEEVLWLWGMHVWSTQNITVEKCSLETYSLPTSYIHSVSSVRRGTHARKDNHFLFSALKSVYCGDFDSPHGWPEPILEHCFDQSSLCFIRCDYAHTCPVCRVQFIERLVQCDYVQCLVTGVPCTYRMLYPS